jgi:peptidoglycan/LPS O-acetylase OafA/YrhL
MRIKELDGLRGIAVLAVINGHYFLWLPITGSAYGWMGVDLFFVLSGFLITSILLGLRKEERYFTIFYSRRVLRIFPPYFLGLAVYIAVCAALGKPGDFRLWSQYLFYYGSLYPHNSMQEGLTQNLPLAVCFGLLVLWSLSVEEIYYTVWAPMVRFMKERTFAAALIAMIVAAPILRSTWYFPGHLETYTFYCRMDGLAYGSAIALLARHRHVSPRAWLRSDRLFDLLAIVVVPCSVVFWLITGASPNKHIVASLGLVLANVSFALITYALIRHAGGNQLWVRIFRAKWLRSIGMVSYSLYLFHYPLLIVSEEVVAKLHLPRRTGAVCDVLLGLALSFAVAYGLWYGMESRILRWKDRKVPSPAHAEA